MCEGFKQIYSKVMMKEIRHWIKRHETVSLEEEGVSSNMNSVVEMEMRMRQKKKCRKRRRKQERRWKRSSRKRTMTRRN